MLLVSSQLDTVLASLHTNEFMLTEVMVQYNDSYYWTLHRFVRSISQFMFLTKPGHSSLPSGI